jgi:hypothetical protein
VKALLGLFALCFASCLARPEPARGPTPTAAAARDGAGAKSGAASGWMPQILSRNAPYLPNFSYAGYHFGERALPDLRPTLEVTDFGARPDDLGDDTEAVKRALAAADAAPGPVVLHFAKGRFIISDVLYLQRSGLILQGSGSGPGGTELFFSRPMAEMPHNAVIRKIEAYLAANDKRADGKAFSPFSWTGGVLWARRKAEPAQQSLARVLNGKRGEHTVRLGAALALTPGSIVRLRWFNREGDDSPLLRHIYGLDHVAFGPRLSDPNGEAVATEEATVRAVRGAEIDLVQPLLHDIEPGWTVDLVQPEFLEEVGIEHLAVTFPSEPYAGHHLERGFNGIYLTGLAHSFVRDVRIQNADSAVLSDDCANLTLSQIAVSGRLGHYGVHIGDVFDVLLQDFRIDSEEFHSVSFNTRSRANVASHGAIFRPSLDQHRGANQQDLFDDLNTLEDRPKSKLFEHGGADYFGPTHAAFNTFWNVHIEFSNAARGFPMTLGRIDDAGPARVVGLTSNAELQLDYARAYVEGLGVPGIAVPSLYRYQLEQRLASAQKPH